MTRKLDYYSIGIKQRLPLALFTLTLTQARNADAGGKVH
jgi:hypothetical protein